MSTVGEFFTSVIEQRLKGIDDQVATENVLMRFLKQAGRMRTGCGGDGFKVFVRSSQSSLARAVGDWSVGQAKTTQTIQALVGTYSAYDALLAVSRRQLQRARYAPDRDKNFEMLFEQTEEVLQDMAARLGLDFYADGSVRTGDDGTPLTGLEAVIDDNNTYLGVDRSTSTWWQSKVDTCSTEFLADTDADGTTDGVAALMTLFMSVCQGAQNGQNINRDLPTRRVKPDVIITSQDGFLKYAKSLLPQQQYTTGRNDPGATLALWGCPMEWCPNCTALRFYVLNMKFLEALIVGPQLIQRDIEDQLGLAGQAAVDAVGFVSQLQLVSRQPRTQGRLDYTT